MKESSKAQKAAAKAEKAAAKEAKKAAREEKKAAAKEAKQQKQRAAAKQKLDAAISAKASKRKRQPAKEHTDGNAKKKVARPIGVVDILAGGPKGTAPPPVEKIAGKRGRPRKQSRAKRDMTRASILGLWIPVLASAAPPG